MRVLYEKQDTAGSELLPQQKIRKPRRSGLSVAWLAANRSRIAENPDGLLPDGYG